MLYNINVMSLILPFYLTVEGGFYLKQDQVFTPDKVNNPNLYKRVDQYQIQYGTV